MGGVGVNRKKETETHYMEEARRASAIFPAGDLIPHELPDFLLRTADETIGIEITELCREQPRAEAGRLSKIPDKAKAIYSRMANAQTVNVSAVFSRHASGIKFNELATSLADFVYQNRNHRGSDFYQRRDLPKGYSHIGLHDPHTHSGHWHAPRAFDVALDPKELIESRIAEKNHRLPEYRLATSRMWLLIVNDQFLGPGQVYIRPESLAGWKFTFDFEKVLLFAREAGGGGGVTELRRS